MPSQIESLYPDYCNATLTIPAADRKPYPYRFDCTVVGNSYIMLAQTEYFPEWNPTWKDKMMTIYF